MRLPGITSISYIEPSLLTPNLCFASLCRIPVAALAPMTRIPFVGEPECEATDAVENNGGAEKVELSFRTEDDPSLLTSRPLAFHIGTASGHEYLIGTRKEQPIVSVITNTGAQSGTPAGYTVKVELQALKSLVNI